MDSTNSWHSGSNCVVSRWGLPVPIFSDELLSSWLVRAALSQGCDPLSLTGSIWPKWRVWTYDIDRGVDLERISVLSYVSGISTKCFTSATIKPMASIITPDKLEAKAVWSWMLTQGSRNRKRKGGLQYCPQCLLKDEKPYYRLRWRFAWHTVCSNCESKLLDRCPFCNSAIEPHRLVATDKYIYICSTCYSDIRRVDVVDAHHLLLSFQDKTDKAIDEKITLYNGKRISVIEWFSLVRHFVSLVRRASVINCKGLNEFLSRFGVDVNETISPLTGLAFELLPINERSVLLGLAYKMTMVNEFEFLESANELSLTVQTFKESKQIPPDCFIEIINKLPCNNLKKNRANEKIIKPKSRRVVMRAWARLQRKYHL